MSAEHAGSRKWKAKHSNSGDGIRVKVANIDILRVFQIESI